MQMGVVDDVAVLAETDIRNKEKVAERMDKVKKLQGQIKGMEDKLSDKEGTIETLERQLVQSGIKDKVRQAETEISKKKYDINAKTDKELYETIAKQMSYKDSLKHEADYQKKEMNQAVKNFEKDLNIIKNNLKLKGKEKQ
jgi:uncharacterized protein with von Willebrand factor type A (vWA) domain